MPAVASGKAAMKGSLAGTLDLDATIERLAFGGGIVGHKVARSPVKEPNSLGLNVARQQELSNLDGAPDGVGGVELGG